MATTTEVLVKNPVLNDIPKSIYDTITPEANEIYAVDMEYTGNKVVVTDASGDVVESATNSAKLAYLDNVSSDIQAQINSKQATITGAASTAVSDNFTADRVVITNGSGKLAATVGVTTTQLGYLSNVSSDIQTQLNGKQASGNYVSYVSTENVDVAGNAKTVSKTDPNCLYVANGLIMGGSAIAAGLVTRGICGVSTPTSTGACTKENLYVNYDGDRLYKEGRQLLLQADIPGTNYGSNLYQYAAARGDAVKGYVDNAISTTAVLDATVSGTSIVDANRVAVIPIAQTSGDYGLVKLSSDSSGIILSNSGTLQTRRATDADISAKTQLYRPIVPANLDLAIKEGLGNNALTWDDTYQTSARNTIGATQVVIREWD